MKLSLTGDTPTTLATGQNEATPLVVDATSVYWATSVLGGAIVRVPIAGGAPVTLVTGQADPSSLAVDTTSLYWTNANDDTGTGTVMKLTPK